MSMRPRPERDPRAHRGGRADAMADALRRAGATTTPPPAAVSGGGGKRLRAAIINVDPVTSGDWEPAT